MPPKCKFTREEIIQAALELARSDGISAITARALGAKLGSSPKPIFSVFENMEEVQREVILAARKLYDRYVQEGLEQSEIPAFKGVGVQYIQFALQEPKLFQLLFMTEQSPKPAVANVLPVIDANYEQILDSVVTGYGLSRSEADALYQHLWIYTHGIAVLCATNMCTFTMEQIDSMLTDIFVPLLKERKGAYRHD